MRGKITDEIVKKACELLNIKKFTQDELRLMPYVQFTLMNGKRLDIGKISAKERKILSSWRKRGWIDGGASEMTVTKEFWNAIHEILWLGYVDTEYGE